MQKFCRLLKELDKKAIFLILALAVILRFAFLSDVPPSLNWDEVSHGFNAYSILKTGKDEWGVTLPVIFRAYGDYKLPVYIYLTAFSELLFGVNAFAVRLPSLIAGVFTVLFTYLLAKRLFNRKVAVFSSLLVAVEPWSLFLSRGAFEANLALALIVSGVYFFLTGLNKAKHIFISGILFGLSLWTYNSARIFVPLFLAALILIYKGRLMDIYKRKPRIILFSLLVTLFFFIPMFYQLTRPEGRARYGKVSILDQGAIAQIEGSRAVSKLPKNMRRFVYNKATYFAFSFTKNWVSHYSPLFLFSEGGTQYQFSIPHTGLLYVLGIPFLITGLLFLIKNRTKESFTVITWLILAPVASSLTREAPHVLRSITLIPVPMVVSALGLVFVLDRLKTSKKPTTRQIFLALYLTGLVISVKCYMANYLLDYRRNYSWSWQYGYKEAVNYVKENYTRYGKIIMTKKYGEPHEFVLFYWPWSPQAYNNDPNLIRFNQSDWFWIDRFDKFYFVNDWQIKEMKLESGGEIDCRNVKCLLITGPGNYPDGWTKLETIDFVDSKPAFDIYENR